MTFLEKIKNGELYDCSFDVIPKELNKNFMNAKNLFMISICLVHLRLNIVIK